MTNAATSPAAGKSDLLVGMKAICQYLSISEATALKWQRELAMPIKKTSENGYWVGSRVKLDAWATSLT